MKMVKITVNLIGEDIQPITILQEEFYNYATKDELENPKCDFVSIGDNMFRKSEIKSILVEREVGEKMG